MRLVKLAIISIVFLFGVVTLISLLIPSQVRISKAIDLTSEGNNALKLVGDKDKWKLWHPAYEPTNDSIQNLWIQQTAWKKITENDSVVIVELQPKGKYPIINGWKLYRHNHSTSTEPVTLQWYMDFKLSWYPWQKFRSLFYEGTYGKMMEIGLNNLKEQAQMK